MKLRASILYVIFAFLFFTPLSYSDKYINPEEASNHIGENRTVCGTVAGTYYSFRSKDHPTFLNLNKPYPDPIFTAVIWGPDRSKFSGPPEKIFRGRDICVTGKVTVHKGIPQIVVQNPSQIRINSDAPPACTRVVDGDTIIVNINGTSERIRLIGVDTPETKHPDKPVEYFGKEAADFLKKMVEGRNVRLDYDWQRRDEHGRLLAYVYLEDGTFLNAEIVKQGYGFAYTRFHFKHLDEFRRYENEAEGNNKGLWRKRK